MGCISPYLCERLRDENQTTDEAPFGLLFKGIEHKIPRPRHHIHYFYLPHHHPVLQTEMDPRKPYFFYFVTNGRTRSGAPIYNILKHTPGSTTPRAFTAEIRCSDLWHEAYSIKDGCSFVQFIEGPEYHISCLGCGREFAKRYLRQGTLVEIRDVPP
ncbi:unnamed protein product [Rhizoctonia solani]|uniref:Uncharacterized protein n=1 Tax=Rhizoctonia solani TaxID=456999 RepID=A0A8H3AK61_9AGAM|nr:unnamed protein product [Rhizoctonia solani]